MKSDSNNKVKVVFYLNAEDKEVIKIQCGSVQIRPSFFYRNAVLEKLGKPIFTKKVHDLDTKKYLTSLIRIGNNLNQIAKKLNSNEQFLIADQQVVLDEKIKKSIKEIEVNLKDYDTQISDAMNDVMNIYLDKVLETGYPFEVISKELKSVCIGIGGYYVKFSKFSKRSSPLVFVL